MPDEVEEDAKFSFSFPDPGQLGRNVIQLAGVSFGFPTGPGGSTQMLFTDVHMGIEQDSRIALVGPNGAGETTAAATTTTTAAAADGGDDDNGGARACVWQTIPLGAQLYTVCSLYSVCVYL